MLQIVTIMLTSHIHEGNLLRDFVIKIPLHYRNTLDTIMLRMLLATKLLSIKTKNRNNLTLLSSHR